MYVIEKYGDGYRLPLALYGRKLGVFRVTFLHMNFASTPTSILNLTIS